MTIQSQKEEKFLSELIKPKSLDPRSKMVLLVSVFIVIFYTTNIYIHGEFLLFTIILLITSKQKLWHILRSILILSLFAGLATYLAFLQNLTDQPINTLIILESRFLNSFFLISWFFTTVKPYELAVVLEKMFFPPKLVWLFTSIYQLVPLLGEEGRRVNEIRKMKGLVANRWNIKRQFYIIRKTLKPLFTGAINRGIDLAEAMTLKGFQPNIRREHVLERKVGMVDIYVMILSIAICVIGILWG